MQASLEIGFKLLFWVCVFIVFYIYFGYSMTIWVIGAIIQNFRASPLAKSTNFPSVAMFIIAHNEEKSLKRKLENSKGIEYAGDFRIICVLDGCVDRSSEVVKQFLIENPDLGWALYEINERVGKEKALFQAITSVESDILVFSDANSDYSSNVVNEFVLQLQRPHIGAVTGHEQRLEITEDGGGKGEEYYTRYNNWIKKQECKFASQTDVNGGVFAIWRKFYPEKIPEGATQDGFIPLHLSLLKKKVAYADKAKSIEKYSLTTKQDFERRIRTVNRAFTSITFCLEALNPFKTGFFSFQIIFHRMLRWFFIFFSLLIFLSGWYLSLVSSFYMILFWSQIIFYLFALFGLFLEKIEKRILIFYIPYYFIYIHIAALIAVFQVFRGRRITIWTPSNK